MTFSVLRALHDIIGEALDDIEAIYALHGSQGKLSSGPGVGRDKVSTSDPPGNCAVDSGAARPFHRPSLSVNSFSNVYASPPPSPCIKTEASSESLRTPLDFPSLDAPYDPTSLSETLTQHPDAITAINYIVAACGQMTATVQTPFLTLCDAVMGYHLPSCMRLFEASHTPEILREAGPSGLHVDVISEKNGVDKIKLAHILRLLATHHIVRELSPDVFTLNRISSTIDTGKNLHDLHRWTADGIPEKKYAGTSGIAAFVGLCSDEIFKSSAYLTETYLLSESSSTRAGSEPTRAPFCFAFGISDSRTGFFGWLEGSADAHSTVTNPTDDDKVETGRGSVYAPVKCGRTHGGPTPNGLGSISVHDNMKASRFRLERFGKAMSGTCSWETPGTILSSFDWHALPQESVIVDVGGGIGSTTMLLASAFPSHSDEGPNLRFIIQDRPVVVEMGEKAWKAKCPEFLDNGTTHFQVHDFFAPQPVKHAAVFLLRVVLHDWPDDFARRILLHLREAAMPNTKLLLGDFILPLACPDEIGGNEQLEGIQGAETMLAPPPLLPNLGKASANAYWMDLTMQAMFNSQERTLREIVALADSAVAVPTTVPSQTQLSASGVASYHDPAFPTRNSPEVAVESTPCGAEVSKCRDKRDERELIDRSSSRCGTPTFGSRMHLSLVEETLSRFSGGIFRSRKSGTVTRGTPKTTSPKQAITLTPVPAVKKKLSSLSVSPHVTSPSPASPTVKVPSSPKAQTSTISQKIIPRRLSLANLRTSSTNREPPPLPNARAPPSPMSPRLSLPRRSSLAQLSTSIGQQPPHPAATRLAEPQPVPVKSALKLSPSSSPKQGYAFSGHGVPMVASPSCVMSSHRGSDAQQPQFQLPDWNSPTQDSHQSHVRARARRSSLAQLLVPPSPRTLQKIASPSTQQAAPGVESRKRTKSVASLSSRASQQATSAVAFISDLGASLGSGLESRVSSGSSRLGGLLSRSGGGASLRSEKSRDVAMPGGLPEFSSFTDTDLDGSATGGYDRDREEHGGNDSEYGTVNVLAAAARIEKRVLRRKGSP
ncbi:Sterigmatocystin 8-O-methyltransferase [Leucoagaricus sp. SymC.cos]|nr:Sterigmatocystin 8-O-methyltransferase [Leucoagaricus sp. SymC.cos]